MSVFDYNRRPTSTTRVGDVLIGSDYPVRLQSMNNTSTNDIAASTRPNALQPPEPTSTV